MSPGSLRTSHRPRRPSELRVHYMKTRPILKSLDLRHSRRWLVCLALAAMALASRAQAQRYYAITGLGTLGGTNCLAYGINDEEQIVGTAQTLFGEHHAFMFHHGYMTDLGTLGGTNSWANGVNDNGSVVGGAELPSGEMHGFVCTNVLQGGTPMMDLGTLGGSNSMAFSINLHDQMVGWAELPDGNRHAFFVTNGPDEIMMDLGPVGGQGSALYCITSDGVAVGERMDFDGHIQAIMSSNAVVGADGMMLMNMDGMGGMGGMGGRGTGALGGRAWFANDSDVAAGEMEFPGGNHHAFISGTGGMMGSADVDLGTLGGSNSVAYCFNSMGLIVGTADLTNGMHHAFLATNDFTGTTHMMDLNDFISNNSGWELTEARGINAAGQIVGWGMHAGHTNGFLLTPVATPVTTTSEPASQIVGPGSHVQLHLGMNAGEPLAYEWLHDGSPIPGATNDSLTLPAIGMESAGIYTVTARNAVGTIARASADVSMFNLMFDDRVPRLALFAPIGRHFRVEFTGTLGPDPEWRTLTAGTVEDAETLIGDAPSASRARFYRVVLWP